MNTDEKVTMTEMCSMAGHDWSRIGSHWVKTHSSWPHKGEPDCETEYIDFRCLHCGQKQSDERVYSMRRIQ